MTKMCVAELIDGNRMGGKQIAISESRGEASMIHGRGDLYVVVKNKHKETWKEKNTKARNEGWGP